MSSLSSSSSLPTLKIYLANPRGFCAGVVRAIEIVERALEKYGPPVYVRHEIVHNRFVVDNLKEKGAIFIDELDEIPDNSHPVIFSAHGVPKSVPTQAQDRSLFYLDATCPLVSKVHREAERAYEAGKEILLIGHKGHPEVIGTMGQLPPKTVKLIETVEDAEKLVVENEANLNFVTQTTLSLEDTKDIIETLEKRFPLITGPKAQDICYATTNRQQAVKELAPLCDAVLVVGSASSSNSNRLVEVAIRHGSGKAFLVDRAQNIPWDQLPTPLNSLGITAGASAPDVLVEEILTAFKKLYKIEVETILTKKENVTFKLPSVLEENPT